MGGDPCHRPARQECGQTRRPRSPASRLKVRVALNLLITRQWEDQYAPHLPRDRLSAWHVDPKAENHLSYRTTAQNARRVRRAVAPSDTGAQKPPWSDYPNHREPELLRTRDPIQRLRALPSACEKPVRRSPYGPLSDCLLPGWSVATH